LTSILASSPSVFQDVKWAQKGIGALKQAGLAPESISIIAKGAERPSSKRRSGSG
jgi:hypothetical protein